MADEFRKGYVLQDGSKNTLVPDKVTVFASPSMTRILRNGKKTDANKTIKGRFQSYQEIRAGIKKEQESADAKAKKEIMGGLTLGTSGKFLSPNINLDRLTDRLANAATTELFVQDTSETPIKKAIKNSFDSMDVSTDSGDCIGITKSGIVDKLKAMGVGGAAGTEGIFLSLYTLDTPEGEQPDSSAIRDAIASAMDSKNASSKKEFLDKATDSMNALSGALSENPAASLSAWFDEQEAIIDSLPSMSDCGSLVYEVEERESGKWYYTGESQYPDREKFESWQAKKASVCAFLMKRFNTVTDKVNDTLEENINKLEKAGPFTTVISLIQSVPSLTSIIKWAKSVIDFLVSGYKLIYSIVKTTIQLLELIIIRGPQLLNKIMKKVTEFDCPVKFGVSVNKK